MQFSIITPSLNQSEFLLRCIASVADQGVEVEHLVQDAGSTDGTLDWLPRDSRVQAWIEPDRGMYDAINRGFSRAQGEIVAWLNCDEQYLAGTLGKIQAFFDSNRHIDMVFGDVVMLGADGRYLCHRKVQAPLLYHTWVCHLSTLSCGMFFRRKVIEQPSARLDTSYRCGGDGEWMVRLLRSGLQMATLGQFTSASAKHDANLSQSRIAHEEWKRLRASAPSWVRLLSPIWIGYHRLRRTVCRSYWQRPFKFSVYEMGNPKARVEQSVSKPTTRCRHKI